MTKRFLMILVFGFLLSSNAFEEIIKFSCEYSENYTGEAKYIIDTSKKELSQSFKSSEGVVYPERKVDVVSYYGTVITYRYFAADGDPRDIYRFDYSSDTFLEYQITPKRESRFTCIKIKTQTTEKPKSTPDDNKIVAASMGSGFFVTRAGHIVTNHHVIDQCKTVKVNYKGNEILAKILASDKTNDLAIIQAKITPNKVYPVSNEDASLLQDVIVAGFPLGKKVSAVIKTHKGNITALAGFGDNFSNFQTDATINQGNSGGPIINLKGNVVGVAVQLIAAEHAQNIFFGVKSSTLKTFANAKGITFLPPNHREMSNENLSKLITEATVYLECWMTVAKIKQIIAQEENRKAFYSKHK